MKRLYRSKKERILGGVCAGLGEHLDVDPTVIRLVWAVVTVLSIGTGLLSISWHGLSFRKKTQAVQSDSRKVQGDLPEISSFTGAYSLKDTTMKILFVVCGEGLGHTSRCLHLGHYLQQQGHTIHFAGYGKSYDFLHQQGCTNLHRVHREVCLEGENGFFSLKKTLWCSKWIIPDTIRSGLSVRRLIRDHHFDCVVCDTMYGGVLAARLEKTPVVFITNQNHFNGLNGTTNPVWMS